MASAHPKGWLRVAGTNSMAYLFLCLALGGGSTTTTKKWPLCDVLKPWSKKPHQNFLTWQKLKRQKS
jgi:hypothetical protein